MESLTKNPQSAATLRAMISRAYGPAQIPDGPDWFTELDDGWFNAVYRIRLRGGEQVVCKIAPPTGVELLTYERDAMTTEIEAIRLIREHTTLPVPRVDFADLSHDLCDAAWFFMPFVTGDNLATLRGAPNFQTYTELVGTATRDLNAIRGTAFGPLQGPGAASWRTVFTGMLEDVLRDGEHRSIDLGHDYATVRAAIERHAGTLDEVTSPRFVSWDLFDGNVLVRDGSIACLIDHERAFYGDPLIEAGFTAVESPSFGDPTGFLRGYGKTSFTYDELRRRRLYTLYLNLIMVIETTYRGFTDPGQAAWCHQRLAETMTLLGTPR